MRERRSRALTVLPCRSSAAGGKRRAVFFALCAFVVLVVFALAACSGATRAQVSARDSVDEYSWPELSAIASEIAAAPDDAAALDVVKRYRLVGSDGRLDGTQRKTVQLADGTSVGAVVAGFRHDEKPGGGKAGITFVFSDAVASRAMNNNAGFDERSDSDGYDAEGGWLASEMRAWLNGEFVDQLPVDLRASLVDVAKPSVSIPEFLIANVDDNNVAEFSDESLMSSGVDKLWLPSVVEVGAPAEDVLAVEERPEWTSVLAGEGTRYQLFADAEQAGSLNAIRVRKLATAGPNAAPCRWWLRSVEDMTFADVRADGSLDRMQDELAAHPLGVVPCFAL